MEHLITEESVVAYRHAGRYLALCGAQVLAASLAAPQRSRCPVCTRDARWSARTGDSMMTDFVTAARLSECSAPPGEILGWLFPPELDETQVHDRVHLLVAVGAVLTGMAVSAGGCRIVGGELGERITTGPHALMHAGARLESSAIQDLIATHCTTGVGYVRSDAVVELLNRFASHQSNGGEHR